MKIIFNSRVGETRDFFMFLYQIYHQDEYNKILDEYGIKPNEEFEKFIFELKQDARVNEEKLKLYYNRDFGLAEVFISNSVLWNYPELDKCLTFIKQLDKDILKVRLMAELINKENKGDGTEEAEEKAKQIISSEQESLSFIKGLEYDSGLKWELFCFIQDPIKYRDDYVVLMEELIPVFYKHYEPRRKAIDEFNRNIERKTKDDEDHFLKEVIGKFFKYDKYDKIFISTSYVSYYGISFSVLDSYCYVYLGIDFEESLAQYEGREEDKLKRYVNIFKNFSDITRFQILRLIIEDEEYSSKDISEKLGITGATVSYHMSNLFTAELVSMNRKDRKNIYSINKDVINDAIEFLEREFKL